MGFIVAASHPHLQTRCLEVLISIMVQPTTSSGQDITHCHCIRGDFAASLPVVLGTPVLISRVLSESLLPLLEDLWPSWRSQIISLLLGNWILSWSIPSVIKRSEQQRLQGRAVIQSAMKRNKMAHCTCTLTRCWRSVHSCLYCTGHIGLQSCQSAVVSTVLAT